MEFVTGYILIYSLSWSLNTRKHLCTINSNDEKKFLVAVKEIPDCCKQNIMIELNYFLHAAPIAIYDNVVFHKEF